MSREPKPLPVERLADGSARYVTIEGDMLDHICWRYYGREWDTVEAVLQFNPGLGDQSPPLRGGVVISLPLIDVPATPVTPVKRLFD